MDENELVYFELNDWIPTTDYPNEEPFISMCCIQYDRASKKENKFIHIPYLRNNLWLKQNKIVCTVETIDMSEDFYVVATKDWVNRNCPNLLTKYRKFLRDPINGIDKEYYHFRKYKEENFNCMYYDSGKFYKVNNKGFAID